MIKRRAKIRAAGRECFGAFFLPPAVTVLKVCLKALPGKYMSIQFASYLLFYMTINMHQLIAPGKPSHDPGRCLPPTQPAALPDLYLPAGLLPACRDCDVRGVPPIPAHGVTKERRQKEGCPAICFEVS